MRVYVLNFKKTGVTSVVDELKLHNNENVEIIEKKIEDFFSEELFKIVKEIEIDALDARGTRLVAFNYPMRTDKQREFCVEYFLKSLETERNIYYYPKPNEYMEVDNFALFTLVEKITSDNFKVELLYRQNIIFPDLRNKLHRLLRRDLGLQDETINKRIFFESRYLFNLSWEWHIFAVDKEYLEYELTECIQDFYPAPKELLLSTTNVCNLKCIMCALHAPAIQVNHKTNFFSKKQFLETNKVYEILDYSGKYGVQMVNLSAEGEVLLDERIFDFIGYAKSVGVPNVFLTTNGTLLDRYGKKLLDSGLDSMAISIDGVTSETYRKIRGFDLDKVENGVVKCVKYARKLKKGGRNISFQLNCVLTLEEMRNQEFQALYLKKWEKYRDVIDRILFIKMGEFDKDGNVVCDSIQSLNDRDVCMLPFSRMVINPYGDVMHCCTMQTSAYFNPVNIGNIHHSALEGIWFGELARILRKETFDNDFKTFNICQNCSERTASVKKLNGDAKTKDVKVL